MKRTTLFHVGIASAIVVSVCASIYAAHTETTVRKPDVVLRFEPEFPAPGALKVSRFDFVLLGTETSFSLPVAPAFGAIQTYRGDLGSVFLLREGRNSFEFRAVSDKGVIGGPSTLDLIYVAPTPTPVPDPVPPPFRAIVEDDSILE